MSATDLAGWCAAALTLATFICRDMLFLRALAICANAAFITYGAVAWLVPVLTLHLALAPVNTWRLLELVARRRERRASALAQPAPASEKAGPAPASEMAGPAPASEKAEPAPAERRAARIHLAACSSSMRRSRPRPGVRRVLPHRVAAHAGRH